MSLPSGFVENFFQRLQVEAFKDTTKLVQDLDAATQLMWTSALKFCLVHEVELCSIINAILRLDHDVMVAPTVVLVRTLNRL